MINVGGFDPREQLFPTLRCIQYNLRSSGSNENIAMRRSLFTKPHTKMDIFVFNCVLTHEIGQWEILAAITNLYILIFFSTLLCTSIQLKYYNIPWSYLMNHIRPSIGWLRPHNNGCYFARAGIGQSVSVPVIRPIGMYRVLDWDITSLSTKPLACCAGPRLIFIG